MILFLDFDGVLHPDPCYDQGKQFCFLKRLESVLLEFPDVEIVISSTWRESRSIEMLRGFFIPEIQQRIVGVTPNWRDHEELFDVIGYQRQTEIEAWIRTSGEPWLKWVAIDDKCFLFKPFLQNLVRTRPDTGFDEIAEKKLRDLLSKF
ncbi:HAD domain-containing protein [Undibacterium danionis]|uniref:HAD domain-containing protein n=1 Tax=Undibacterium danionis TaxID=1812100 RepID=A0ABV6IED6_9BURK